MSFFRGHFEFCGELVRSLEPRIYSSRAVLITHNVALHYTWQAMFEEVSNFPTVLYRPQNISRDCSPSNNREETHFTRP